MKLRKPIIAGNWKMHKSLDEAGALARDIKIDLGNCVELDIVLCPPFTALKTVGDAITGSHIKLGAQNMHWEREGAFTGEVSPTMLRDVYCHYVIIGHSERRMLFSETDETINRKIKSALAASLRPIMCVGERLEERQASRTRDVIRSQLEGGLAGIKEGITNMVIAYEPVWAIGTGLTATPEQAQEIHLFIREVLTGLYDAATAQTIRIQYGGSVKAGNAAALFGQPDIDGGLIGGAALDAASFVAIAKSALRK